MIAILTGCPPILRFVDWLTHTLVIVHFHLEDHTYSKNSISISQKEFECHQCQLLNHFFIFFPGHHPGTFRDVSIICTSLYYIISHTDPKSLPRNHSKWIFSGSSWPQATRGDANARASAEVGERGRSMSLGIFTHVPEIDRMVFNAGWCGLRDCQGTSEMFGKFTWFGWHDVLMVWWLDNVKIGMFFLLAHYWLAVDSGGEKEARVKKRTDVQNFHLDNICC